MRSVFTLQSAWPFLLALQNQRLLSRLQKSELISVVFCGQKPWSETWESAVLSSALTQTLVVSLISINTDQNWTQATGFALLWFFPLCPSKSSCPPLIPAEVSWCSTWHSVWIFLYYCRLLSCHRAAGAMQHLPWGLKNTKLTNVQQLLQIPACNHPGGKLQHGRTLSQ